MPGVKTKTDANMNLVPFSWDEYLKGSDDKPAPKCCFKQAAIPPTNQFQVDMKLESRDPRNSMSFCVATVIATCGPRLCLRLDGSDNRNDFWSLVDSDDIHPCGWCESIGEQLQPPLGFAKNASYYPAFLQKLLQESRDKMAPECYFKPVPQPPPRSMFEIGMKLEAIDRKNPHLIGPATIGDIDGDKILIQFDGWRGAFDYWCRYDSRDIFPVGWCSATNHPLQPPGTKGNVARGRSGGTSTKPASISPNLAVHIDTSSYNSGIPSPGSTRSAGSKKNSPGIGRLISPAASLSPADGTSASGVTVTAYVNQTCQCGPHLNQTSIIRLPLHYGPSNINRTLRKVVQALVDSANNPAMIFNNLSTAPSNVSITAKIAGKINTCTLPAITTQTALQAYIGSLLQRIECCVNLITLQPMQRACDKCVSRSNSSSSSSTLTPSAITATNHSQPPATSESLKRQSSSCDTQAVSVKRSKSRNLSSPARRQARLSVPKPLTPSDAAPTHSVTNDSSHHAIISSNPTDWTADDVIRFMRTKDPSLAKYSHLIQSHEIDGKAFLMMSSDIAIRYMNMKVGPALKLCSLVDDLRAETF